MVDVGLIIERIYKLNSDLNQYGYADFQIKPQFFLDHFIKVNYQIKQHFLLNNSIQVDFQTKRRFLLNQRFLS